MIEGVGRAYNFNCLDGDNTYAGTCPLGSVVAKEGYAVAFSNDYQHRVLPFSLADNTKPGYRKIVALFLVDPEQKVVDTSDIFFQDANWMLKFLLSVPIFRSLPREVILKILQHVPNVWSMSEAKNHREKLMRARSVNAVADTLGTTYHACYSLCEH